MKVGSQDQGARDYFQEAEERNNLEGITIYNSSFEEAGIVDFSALEAGFSDRIRRASLT